MTTARSPRPHDADRPDASADTSASSTPDRDDATTGGATTDTGSTDTGAMDTGSVDAGPTDAPRAADDPTAEKPVEEWVTGDEPMTGPQRSYLQTLAREAGEELPEEELTKAAASELIERLQRATGRIPADRQR